MLLAAGADPAVRHERVRSDRRVPFCDAPSGSVRFSDFLRSVFQLFGFVLVFQDGTALDIALAHNQTAVADLLRIATLAHNAAASGVSDCRSHAPLLLSVVAAGASCDSARYTRRYSKYSALGHSFFFARNSHSRTLPQTQRNLERPRRNNSTRCSLQPANRCESRRRCSAMRLLPNSA